MQVQVIVTVDVEPTDGAGDVSNSTARIAALNGVKDALLFVNDWKILQHPYSLRVEAKIHSVELDPVSRENLMRCASRYAACTKSELIDSCRSGPDLGQDKPASYYKDWTKEQLVFYLLEDYIRMKEADLTEN